MFRNSKKNEILRNTFGKRSVDVYIENHKTCWNKLKKTQVNGKVHGLEASIVKKAGVFPKLTYRVSAVPMQVPADFLAESDKLILENRKASIARAP